MAELAAWMQGLLSERRYAVVGTLNDNGSMHLTPVWYLFDDGVFYVGCPSSSRKARNVRARPQVTLLVDDRTVQSRERWISASGVAEVIIGSESSAINARIRERYLTTTARNDPRIDPAFAASDDMTIRLRPDTWRSWRAEDLDAKYFGGILGALPERWFLPVM